MKALFLLNPAAGHGRCGRRWQAAYDSARRLWPEHELRVTERPGHGRELAREAARAGAGLVLAAGGDGTLSEAADGLLSAGAGECALAAFPAGSGCDFARHAGIPSEPAAWARFMAAARPRRLDAGRVESAAGTHHFLNMAGLGLAGEVAAAVARRGKPLGGALAYLLEGTLAVLAARPRRMTLVVDGREEAPADYHLVALANTRTTGGGMRMAPDADPEDGLFDLLTIGPVSRAALLSLLPRAYTGAHLGRPGVTLRRAARVEVRCEEPLTLNVDGDVLGRAPAVFQLRPRALPFLF